MYLTYDEYQDMGGTLDETTFDSFCWEAQSIIDWYTFNRLQKETVIPEAVKRCMVDIIRLAQLKAEALMLGQAASGSSTAAHGNPMIASQSNDGVSISYNIISASEVYRMLTSTGSDNPVEIAVRRYLNGITNSLGRKLLYKGLYPGE